MTVSKSFVFGAAALVLTGLYPHEALGESFKNKDFLQLENEQKKYWLVASIEAIWQVKALIDKKTAQCIADWYYKDAPNKTSLVEAYMKKYPEYTPASILITLTEKACT